MELWLGSHYNIEDSSSLCKLRDGLRYLLPVEESGIFPKLQHLGLVNCRYIDSLLDIAIESALVKRIVSLDLKNGCLGNIGASKLMKLDELDTCLLWINIKWHYIVSLELLNKLTEMKILVLNLEEKVDFLHTGDDDDEYFDDDDDDNDDDHVSSYRQCKISF